MTGHVTGQSGSGPRARPGLGGARNGRSWRQTRLHQEISSRFQHGKPCTAPPGATKGCLGSPDGLRGSGKLSAGGERSPRSHQLGTSSSQRIDSDAPIIQIHKWERGTNSLL